MNMEGHMRTTLAAMLIAAALAIAVLTPQPTRADFNADKNLCFGTGSSTDFTVRVAACTRQIKSGRWQGRNLAITYLNRGNLYKANGAYDQAIADYDEAIRLDRKDVKAYNNRGLAWMMKGAFDRAIADLNQAIRLDPKYEDAFVNRGGVYYRKGNYANAVADYTEAFDLAPSDVEALYWRGKSKLKNGDETGGEADIAAARKINPKFAPVQAEPKTSGTDGTDAQDRSPSPASAPAPAPQDESANAVDQQDFSKCIATDSGDEGLGACTRSIESGHYQGHALALLYLSRAFKYDRTEHDYPRAVADYEQSLALNPQEDAAVKNVFLPEAKRKAGHTSASPLDSIPVASGAKVLETETLTVGANGTSGNVKLPARGIFTIDYAVAASAEIRLAVITAEQFQQAATGHKMTPGGLLNVVIHGVGSRSVTLDRGTYAVVFIQPSPPNAVLTYRASYRRTN
jgi:tetratricopeptide (TPR) repeat protein